RLVFHYFSLIVLFRSHFEMRQRIFSVLCYDVCVALLAIVNGHLEVSDAFFGMRIVLRLLRRLSMLKRGFSVLCFDVCVALLAIVNGYLRIFDGFGQMILG